MESYALVLFGDILKIMIISCCSLYWLNFEYPHCSHLANGLLSCLVILVVEHVCAHLW